MTVLRPAENRSTAFTDELITGRSIRVTPLVRRILAPNPSPMTGPGTNTYLVGDADVTVIDPGPDDAAHVAAILDAAGSHLTRILCTHTHIDHWPAAVEIAARTGAEILAFGSRDGLEVTRTLSDGAIVSTAEYRIQAVHTPGHASNHLCYLLCDEALLFSGDHIMQGSTVVISPPDGDMGAYLASLDLLQTLDPPLRTIAPAHGHLLHDPDAIIDGYRAHRFGREQIIADALDAVGEGGVTVDGLVPVVYADVHEALHPVARRSLWAHLRKLVDDGRATVDDPNDIDNAIWRTA